MSETAILSCRGISKSFRSGEVSIEVLKDLNLEMQPGETLSIRGESGSGKTTFLNILSGLENPDAGELLWEGEPVGHWSMAKLARRRGRFIGMVFQNFYLIPELTAIENVLIACRMLGGVGGKERKRADDLLARVGLAERRRHLTAQLSGGERQRVAMARALVNQPRLVLADEPTGNLDERTGDSMMDLLLEICAQEGVTLALVTHNKAHAVRAGRQVQLHLGALEAIG
jgi:predicted ABC-type transport system involved in lysophospholipase L1 biosynthesis ATPase subunit